MEESAIAGAFQRWARSELTALLPVEATGILSSLAGITEVAREAFDDAPRKGER